MQKQIFQDPLSTIVHVMAEADAERFRLGGCHVETTELADLGWTLITSFTSVTKSLIPPFRGDKR